MSNTYFQFKQFTVHQDRCAMKVSTDACIAGSWTKVPADAKRVLDIGTGTGLLALMLAQKNQDVIIDGIELDTDAAEQARENVAASHWADRINIIQADASLHLYKDCYDFIITNPPFFNKSLLSHKEQRNMARHTGSLNYMTLFNIINDNLADNGFASVLLPVREHEIWADILRENKWSVIEQLNIYPGEAKPANRIVSICTKQEGIAPKDEHLAIRSMNGAYTTEFNKLMQSYYLDK
ncbi:MAG: methyltransferase [Taibaiella sp.]|nr:methyltransferase [Taibaiella sp.]